MRWALLVVLAGCSVYSVDVHYPVSSRCTTVLAFATDTSTGSRSHRSDTTLHIIDLATHREVSRTELGPSEFLGASADGPVWLTHRGVVEARDACTGALLTDLNQVRARHPELGTRVMQFAYDTPGLRLMNERAEDFLIDAKTFAVSRTTLVSARTPEKPAGNWVRWPGESDFEVWALWGAGVQHLTRTADILANHDAPKPASPLQLFGAELLHDAEQSALIGQSVLVSYHHDLVDPHLWISRVARSGDVMWTRDAATYQLDEDRPRRHEEVKPHDFHVAAGLVFAVVREHLVAIDPDTGAVRWRMSLTD